MDYYESALANLKRSLPTRTENQSFDWWCDLFCANNPREAIASVIIGDTVTDKVNKKAGKVVETFVMPWLDSDKYREWVALMRQKWDIDGEADLVSDIHYGGVVVIPPEDFVVGDRVVIVDAWFEPSGRTDPRNVDIEEGTYLDTTDLIVGDRVVIVDAWFEPTK